MGFFPCLIEPDIWTRDKGDHYEHIAAHMDDLLIESKEPQSIMPTLSIKHEFKLKGTGPIAHYLGCDFGRDDDSTLCFTPRMHIEKMEDCYFNMFGCKPKLNHMALLKKGDHPEMDASDCLDEDGVEKHQSLIGSIQWSVSLGRFDDNASAMTLASFRTESRQGHLERAKRVVSYLIRFKNARIRFRSEEPDLSSIPSTPYEWEVMEK